MKKIYELKNQRTGVLKAAEAALDAKDMDTYDAKMEEVKAINAQIEALEVIEAENTRFEGQGIANLSGLTGGLTDRNDDEYKNAFFYAICNGITPKNGANIEKVAPLYNALTTSGGSPAGADGGFLVPTSFNNLIIEQRRQLIALADLFTVETVTTPTGWRSVDTAPTTGFAAVDEMGTISAAGDQPAFTKVTYSLSKYGLRVPVSNELLTDNTAGLEAYLARWFAKKGVITENVELLAALATLTPSNLTVGSEVDALKTAITMSLDPEVAKNAGIITNQSGFAYLDGLKGTDGRGLLQPDPTTGTPMIFRSHPVTVISDAFLANKIINIGDGTDGTYYPVYIGDFKEFATVFKDKTLQVASSNIGGNAWASDSTEVRGIMRIDVQKVDSAAVIKREIFIAE